MAATLPPAGDPNTLYIIDVSGYVFRAYHALPPLSSPSGEPTHAVLGVTTMLQKLVTDYKPALIAVAMDSRTPSFRRELYPEYKANRPPAPPDLRQQMARVYEVIDAMQIAMLQRDGVEADDIIATAVRWARAQGMRVVIVSSDKDLMQLIGDDVWMLDGARNVTYGPAEVEAKLGVPPRLVHDYLAFVGDTSDNIPGVASVGPKTAVTLLKEHGSLEAIYANLAAVTKVALREKLTTHKDNALISHKLVALRDDIEVVLDRATLTAQPPDAPRLRKLFVDMNFVRLIGTIPESTGAPAAAAVAASGANLELPPSVEPLAPRPPAEPLSAAEVILEAEPLAALVGRLQEAPRVALSVLVEGEHLVSSYVVGFAFAWGTHAAYVPVGHAGLGRPDQLATSAVLEALGPFLTAARATKLCIDSKREIMALGAAGASLAGIEFDCMLASYLIDPERHSHSLADIARFDLDEPLADASKALLGRVLVPGSLSGEEPTRAAELIGAALRTALRSADKLSVSLTQAESDALLADMELPLARVLARIESTGIRLDARHLQELGSKVSEDLVRLEARCRELAGRDFNVGAPRQLEAILFDELKLPVIKRTKTARSTDHEVLEDLAALHELPGTILEHRMLAKLKSTYIDSLPKQVNAKTGRIHTDFRQAVAATGRLSSSDPNLQNIPIRTETGRSIREAFVPKEGWLLCAADYSQIELRILAHLSKDAELMDAYRTASDVHVRTARALFDVDDAGVTREMRGQAKTVNFAVIYGQTQFALARNLRIERSKAGRYIEAFFKQYAGVASFMERIIEEARVAGEVRTLAGRARKLPDLNSADRVRRQAAERVARNTPIQGTAADILKLAMIGIDRAIREANMQARMLLTVHDEIVCEAPPDEREALEALLRQRMEHVIALEVPLVVEVGWGATWGRAH